VSKIFGMNLVKETLSQVNGRNGVHLSREILMEVVEKNYNQILYREDHLTILFSENPICKL
jgi:hypothetical protein